MLHILWEGNKVDDFISKATVSSFPMVFSSSNSWNSSLSSFSILAHQEDLMGGFSFIPILGWSLVLFYVNVFYFISFDFVVLVP